MTEDDTADFGFAVLLAAFTGIVVLTNTVGTKLTTVFGLTLPVSIFWFPFTFLITDITSEIYGARRAHQMVYIGFGASVALLLAVLVGLNVPAAPGWVLDEQYKSVFSPTWRLLFASMLAYLLAQSIDVRIFHWLKNKNGPLWLRNNVSTMTSQFVDSTTVVFVFLYKNEAVFKGSVSDLMGIVLSVYVAKVVVALLDTPLCYVGVSTMSRFRQRWA